MMNIEEDDQYKVIMSQMHARLFRILATMAIVSNFLGFASNIALRGFTWKSSFFGICTLVMIFCGIFGRDERRRMICEHIILVLACFIEFPIMIYLYGYGRGLYCIMGIVAAAVLFKRPEREAFTVAATAIDVIAIVLCQTHPSSVQELGGVSAMIGMLCSLIIVVPSVFLFVKAFVAAEDYQRDEMVALGEKLAYQANHDPLTGAFNRQHMDQTIGSLIEAGKPFVMALIDIDDFKKINDTYGHMYGDDVLRNLVKILVECTHGHEDIYRFGGEEFVIVFPDEAADAAAHMLDEAQQHFGAYTEETKQFRASFSGGIDVCDERTTLDDMLKTIDDKLYTVKRTGKHRVML